MFQKISRTSLEPPDKVIRDGIKLAQLVIARDCQSLGHWFDSVITPKKETKTQIYKDLSYIDPEASVLNDCFK